MGKNTFGTVMLGGMIGLLLSFPDAVKKAALEGMNVFAAAVFPPLFPMLILMLLWVSRFSPSGWARILPCFLMGSPGGTKLVLSGHADEGQAKFLCAVTGTLSPMFFLSAMEKIAPRHRVMLFLCHILGALCTAVLFKRGKLEYQKRDLKKPLTFLQAVGQSGKTMLLILSCVILGKVVTAVIFSLFPLMPPEMKVFISCAAEIAGGLQALCAFQMDMNIKLILISAAASFGGFSLLMQNGALWRERGISLCQLFLIRCIHAVLSAFLCTISLRALP